MASLVERLQWIVSADGTSAINTFKKIGASAETELKKAENASKNLGSSLTKFGAVGAAAGGVIGASLIKAAGSFENLAITSSKFADATGLTVQASSKWIEVTKDMGVSSDTLGSALNKMNKTLGASPQVFAKYGVAIAHAKDGTVDVNQTFLNVVDRLNAIPNASDKAAAATAILGKGWTGLSELIATGSTTLKQSLDSVSAAKTIDPAEAQKAKDYRAAIDSLTDSLDDLVISVGQGAAPVIGGLAKVIGGAIEGFDRLDAVTGGFVGKVATIAALGVGVAGVGGVIVGQAIKITTNLTSAAGAVGKYTSGIAAKRAAEAASTAETEAQTASLATFSEANVASIESINARSAALGAETGSIAANTAALEANGGALTTLTGGIAGAATSGAGLLFLASSIGGLVGEAQHAQAAATNLKGAIGDLANATTATATFDDMTAAFGKFLDASLSSGGQFTELKKFVDQDIDGAKRLSAALKAGNIEGFGDGPTKNYIKTLDAAIAKQGGVATAQAVVNQNVAEGAGLLEGLAVATDGATAADDKRAASLANTGLAAAKMAGFVNLGAEASAAAAAAAEKAAADHDNLTNAWKLEADAEASATANLQKNVSALQDDLNAHQALVDAMRANADATFALDKATADYNDSTAGLSKAVKAAKGDQAKLTVAYDDHTQAAIAVADATSKVYEQTIAAAGGVETATQKIDVFNHSLLDQAQHQAPAAQKSIVDYLTRLNGIKPEVATKILAEVQAGDLDQAKADLDAASANRDTSLVVDVDGASIAAANNQIQNGINKNIKLSVSGPGAVALGFAKGGVSSHASGTQAAKPGLSEVAEAGAEIVVDDKGARLVKKRSLVMLRGGERIYNARDTAAILAGGAGTGAGMQLPGYADGAGSPINGTGRAQQTYNLVVSQNVQSAQSAPSSSDGVDAQIKEQDRLQAAEYHTNRISLEQYKQYVKGRLASSKDLSDDYLNQYDLLQQLADTEKQTADARAQAAKDAASAEKQAADDAIAAQDDLMKNEAALGVISQAQYKDYLTGRLGTYAQYSDGYTQIALQIKAIDDQQVADQTKAAQDARDARVKAAQEAADRELGIYKQLQADKAVVDATAEQDRQTAEVRAAGEAGSKVQNDKNATNDDKAKAVQALSDSETKLAEDTFKTILSKADAANLTEGSVDWDRFVSGLLRAAIDTYNQNGFSVTAAALGGDLSGIPQLAKGGIVKRRPGGHLLVAGEGAHDEAIVPLTHDGQFGGVTNNYTTHNHLPAGWSPEHALIATNQQARRRGYRGPSAA